MRTLIAEHFGEIDAAIRALQVFEDKYKEIVERIREH